MSRGPNITLTTRPSPKQLLGCAILVVALGACGNSSADSSTLAAPSSAFDVALEEATSGGAAPSQVAIIERARDNGELSIADVQEALEGAFACMDESQIGHTLHILDDPAGFSYVSYDMTQAPGLSEEQSVAIADQCVKTYSGVVERLYMQQPVVLESLDRYNETVVRPALIACFNQYGETYDDRASWAEFWDSAFAVVKADPASKPGDPTAAGCILGVTVGPS